ncbi:MAG: hypothetical protein JWP94_3424 [Mucilaginibacter sp.]|nr:hypothetical protein [Mucilaginibacter sp.]
MGYSTEELVHKVGLSHSEYARFFERDTKGNGKS